MSGIFCFLFVNKRHIPSRLSAFWGHICYWWIKLTCNIGHFRNLTKRLMLCLSSKRCLEYFVCSECLCFIKRKMLIVKPKSCMSQMLVSLIIMRWALLENAFWCMWIIYEWISWTVFPCASFNQVWKGKRRFSLLLITQPTTYENIWTAVNWNDFRVLLTKETCMFETKRRTNLTLLESHFNPNYRLSHVFPSRQWCRIVWAGPLQTAERTNNTSGLKFTGLSLITGTRAASLLQKVRRRLTWRSPKWSSKRIFVFLLRPLRLMPNFDRSAAWYL